MADALPSNSHDYLVQELDRLASRFDGEATKNYGGLFGLRLAVIALTCLTTIAVGLGTEGWSDAARHTVRNAALILSATATAVTAWETFWNYRTLWIRDRLTAGRLKGLRAEVDWRRITDSLTPEAADRIFAEMQTVLAEANSEWGHVQASTPVPADTRAPKKDPAKDPAEDPAKGHDERAGARS
jgi:hypothetical protein